MFNLQRSQFPSSTATWFLSRICIGAAQQSRRQGTTASTARFELLPLISLSGLWIILSVLVNPIGDFPLNDDWVYASGVKSILETGRFQLPESAPNVFAQAYWGALFCLPFGFSFTALRLSTVTLGGIGVIGIYLILRELGGDRWTALLGSLCLAVNPIYLGLAHTFMTDVPFLSMMIAAVWCFLRGIRHQTMLIAAIMIALVAILIRQFALILLVAFGFAYVVNRGLTWKALVIAIMPVGAGVALHIMYQHWLVNTGRIPSFGLSAPHNLHPFHPLQFVKYSARQAFSSLPYLGFFITPFLASLGLSGRCEARRRRRLFTYLAITALAVVTTAILYNLNTEIPEVGNILTPTGLGPQTLRDTFIFHQNLPEIPSLTVFWFIGLVLGLLGGAAILVYLADCVLRVVKGLWRSNCGQAIWLEAFIIVFIGSYTGLLLLLGFGLPTPLFDRYLLSFTPLILMLVLVCELRRGFIALVRWRGMVALGLIMIYGSVSVAATHDYLAWNRARWTATGMLIAAGVSPNQIDGGYEFNGWYLYDPRYRHATGKSWWWVDDDEYLITSGPMNGYREIERVGFPRWLSFSESAVVILRRQEEKEASLSSVSRFTVRSRAALPAVLRQRWRYSYLVPAFCSSSGTGSGTSSSSASSQITIHRADSLCGSRQLTIAKSGRAQQSPTSPAMFGHSLPLGC